MMREAVVLGLLLLAASGQAQAVSGVFVEAGAGNSVDIARLGMSWKWDRSWTYPDGWRITGAWEVALGILKGVKPGQNNQTFGDVGITPVFRLAPVDDPDALYFEGGFLGLHLFSKAFAYEAKKFGSAFQFGHFVGAGMDFGERREFSLSYRFQHMSNGGIVQPNQGVNLSELHLAYFF